MVLGVHPVSSPGERRSARWKTRGSLQLGSSPPLFEPVLKVLHRSARLSTVENLSGRAAGLAVDQIATEALQDRGVGIGVELVRRRIGAHIDGVGDTRECLQLLQGVFELREAPRGIEGGNAHTCRVQIAAISPECEAGLILAQAVEAPAMGALSEYRGQ